MSKRVSNKSEEWTRRKRAKASRSDGPVMEKKVATFPRGRNKYAGHRNKRSKSNYQPGDIRTAFGKVDYVAFRGGEGGRGWSVPSTLS